MNRVSEVFAVCPHDCPDTCGWLVSVDGERATAIRGNSRHPFTKGKMCVKTKNYLRERVYSPERILYPMRRKGPKGSGEFEVITWDEAVDEICLRLESLSRSPGGSYSILPYRSSGTMGLVQGLSMGERFFNRLGASSVKDTICCGAGEEGLSYTIGKNIGADPESVVASKLIILWGTNTVSTNQHFWQFVKVAREKGAYLVVIDPVRTKTAEKADLFLQINPGTDGALAMGIMNYLITYSAVDLEYVKNHTVGYERLEERVREYSLEKVSKITGLSRGEIELLCEKYARTRPSFIRANWGIQRHGSGGMTVRAISCLPALTGDWKYPGGGFLISTSGAFPINYFALKRPDLRPVKPRVINMCRLGEALLEADPPIKFLFVYGANPAASAPGQKRIVQGLLRDDLFTVVHEQFMTDTADYADIILPATTQLEHCDLHVSYGHLYLAWNEPAIKPCGEAKSNNDVFRLLARRMGFSERCFEDRDEDIAGQALSSGDPALEGITVERLKKEGFVRLNVPDPYLPFKEGNFFTPSGKCEFYSERLASRGYDPLPGYQEPFELNNSRGPYPLVLLSPADHYLINSTFGNSESFLRRGKQAFVEINEEDARERGIVPGTKVVVLNDRGSFSAVARISDRVKKGVAYTTSVRWPKLSGGSNVNATVPERDADMGGGPTFYDNRVEIYPEKG